MFAVATFSVSLVALVGLFAFKDWEIRRDIRFFPALRKRLNTVVETKVIPMKEALPEVGRQGLIILGEEARRRLVAWTLHTLHAVEGLLLHSFLFVRGKRTLLHSSESVSPFLRDVAEHKKSLAGEKKELLQE